MNKIACGIVLYNPDIKRLIENIDNINKQVELLVLIDNHSKNIDLIKETVQNYNNVILIENEINKGIACALNQIMNFCKENDYDWVLTLDQDSVSPYNLISEYKKYMNIDKLGVISPVIVDRNKDEIDTDKSKICEYEYIDKCITSASLVKVSVWEEVGKFDEFMFIDLVDFEFCKRIIDSEYKIIKINKVKLLHEIGNIKQKKIFFKTINVMNHSAFRKYYMSRNIIYYDKLYPSKNGKIKTFMSIIKIFLLVILFEKDKKNKLKNIKNGVIDGMKIKVV